MPTAASTPGSQKRRQAVQVTAFLAGVAALTTALFHSLRDDLVSYRRGEQAIARGDFESARAALEHAWERGYRTPHARLELARARLEAGDKAGALALYAEALTAAPPDPGLVDTVVGLYQGAGQPEKGLALHERLGPLEMLDLAALVRRGDLLQQLGDLPRAAQAYRLAAQRAPSDPQIQLRLGTVLAWTGNFAEAIEALRRAVALEPGLRSAQLQLARVLSWDGRFAESVIEFRRVLPP